MEHAIVYPNRHVRITSNIKLNNQKNKRGTPVYINYGGLKYLISKGISIRFTTPDGLDITELMLKKIDLQMTIQKIKIEKDQYFPPIRREYDNSDDYDPYASRNGVKS